MDGWPLRQSAIFIQEFPAVDPDLIQLKKSADGLGIALPGLVQKAPPLIQFFFFCMGSSPSFHFSKPFSIQPLSWMGLRFQEIFKLSLYT